MENIVLMQYLTSVRYDVGLENLTVRPALKDYSPYTFLSE